MLFWIFSSSIPASGAKKFAYAPNFKIALHNDSTRWKNSCSGN